MRKQVVAGAIAILVVAGLGVGYLATTSTSRNPGTSFSMPISTYQTLVSSTTYNSTVHDNTSITEYYLLTSTLTKTWASGQPIPVASIETANITIGGYQGVALDQHSGRIYVAGGSHLLVIDTTSHSQVANITLPGGALGGIAIDDKANAVFVSVHGEVAEIRASTNSIVGEFPFDVTGPLAYNPSTRVIYGYSAAHQRFLVGADVRTGTMVANISVGPTGWYGNDVLVNPNTGLVYAVGCHQEGLVCGGPVTIVNGTSETLAKTVDLNPGTYPTLVLNPATNVVYLSALGVVTFSGTDLDSTFHMNPMACGPFPGMAVIPSSNQIAVVDGSGYLLVFDGASGKLVNMYYFPPSNSVSFAYVGYDQATNEFYTTTNNGQLVSFHAVAATGNVNSTLIRAEPNCPLP
jgi:hypothetical protein